MIKKNFLFLFVIILIALSLGIAYRNTYYYEWGSVISIGKDNSEVLDILRDRSINKSISSLNLIDTVKYEIAYNNGVNPGFFYNNHIMGLVTIIQSYLFPNFLTNYPFLFYLIGISLWIKVGTSQYATKERVSFLWFLNPFFFEYLFLLNKEIITSALLALMAISFIKGEKIIYLWFIILFIFRPNLSLLFLLSFLIVQAIRFLLLKDKNIKIKLSHRINKQVLFYLFVVFIVSLPLVFYLIPIISEYNLMVMARVDSDISLMQRILSSIYAPIAPFPSVFLNSLDIVKSFSAISLFMIYTFVYDFMVRGLALIQVGRLFVAKSIVISLSNRSLQIVLILLLVDIIVGLRGDEFVRQVSTINSCLYFILLSWFPRIPGVRPLL